MLVDAYFYFGTKSMKKSIVLSVTYYKLINHMWTGAFLLIFNFISNTVNN